MLKSANRFLTLCGFSLALCTACEQQADDPSPATPNPMVPGATSGPAGGPTQPGVPGAMIPGVNAPGAAPADGAPAAAGSPSASGAKPPTADEPEPYAGLPIGPELQVDPAIAGLERFVPTDSRAPKQALQATPISGGTLLITTDGLTAVAADPERDRVSIVDLTTTWLLGHVALQAGDEPGRMVQDPTGRVHVALRRAGAVASIDLLTRTVVARRNVCASPRGIAYEASTKMLKVACVGGELVDLPAATGEVASRVRVDSDLRDVVESKNGGLFVTRLKSAELVRVDAAGAIMSAARPSTPTVFFPVTDGSLVADTVEPVGARRTVESSDGGFIMLHQGARNGDIEVSSEDDPNAGVGSSPYGGTGSCTGVVSTEVTHFTPAGEALGTVQFGGAVLAVDIAESAKTPEFAVALAGAADPLQPLSQIVNKGQVVEGTGIIEPAPGDPPLEVVSVLQFEKAVLETQESPGTPTCVFPINGVALPAPATAVAYAGDRLVVQTREPAALYIVDSALNNQGTARVEVLLGGPSLLDTGHEIFHRDAGAGVACASCHIEGGDDGHVWHFVDQGPRRTQSMLVGLEGTAPFHWVGDMNDLGTLMENVFVGRMGGVHQTTARMAGLEEWLYAIKPPPPLRNASDDAAVEHGRNLFYGTGECGTCHTGAKFTNNQTVDVGTGAELQVPSLVGVAYRGPWIHTGCAATLRDRFDPACGGDRHGKTEQFTPTDVDDLIAFLETL